MAIINSPGGSGSGAATDGWSSSSDTWTYASATTFTITGVDRTTTFTKGTRLRLTQTTVKYFVVVASSFAANTTVTVTGGTDYSLANAAIAAPAYSYAANPQGYPTWFNFAPAVTGFSGTPTVNTARFNVCGDMCTLVLDVTGTSNATSAGFTAPVATVWTNNDLMGPVTDGGSSQANIGGAYLSGAGTGWAVFKTLAGNTWTNTGTKAFRLYGFYQF